MAVNDNDPHLVSRRPVLQAAAAIAPLTVAGGVVVLSRHDRHRRVMHQTFSHSESYGAVHNPYDFNRGPGGSSGGNGALMYRDRRRGPIKLKTLDLPSIEEQTKIVADAASRYADIFRSKGVAAIGFPRCRSPQFRSNPAGRRRCSGGRSRSNGSRSRKGW